MIIDAHVYCVPPELRKPAGDLSATEAAIWESLFSHPEGPAALELTSLESIRLEMKRADIDKSVLVALPWNSMERCRRNNDYLLDAIRSDKGFFAICSVNPFASDWKEEVLRCQAQGGVGIKINLDWQGGRLSDQKVIDLANFCADRNMFIMTHIDHAFKVSGASAAEMFLLLEKCPHTKFIAAHMGGMAGMYFKLPRIQKLLQNVWFDTAVSYTLEMVEAYVKFGLSDKIVFGSDFPFNHSHQQKQVKDDLIGIVGSKGDLDKILSGNLLRLLNG